MEPEASVLGKRLVKELQLELVKVLMYACSVRRTSLVRTEVCWRKFVSQLKGTVVDQTVNWCCGI